MRRFRSREKRSPTSSCKVEIDTQTFESSFPRLYLRRFQRRAQCVNFQGFARSDKFQSRPKFSLPQGVTIGDPSRGRKVTGW